MIPSVQLSPLTVIDPVEAMTATDRRFAGRIHGRVRPKILRELQFGYVFNGFDQPKLWEREKGLQ